MDRPMAYAAAGPHAWPGVGVLLEKLHGAGHRVRYVGISFAISLVDGVEVASGRGYGLPGGGVFPDDDPGLHRSGSGPNCSRP